MITMYGILILLKDHEFVMPGAYNNKSSLQKESDIADLLIDKLTPEDDDMVIIGNKPA